MITGTISSKGQVTIPKKIREVLKVKTSSKCAFWHAKASEAGKSCIVKKDGNRYTEKAGKKDVVMVALDTNALVRMSSAKQFINTGRGEILQIF